MSDTHPPREFCTAFFTIIISSVKPGETKQRTYRSVSVLYWGVILLSVCVLYHLQVDAEYWTGTAAGRLEEPGASV